MGEVELLYTRKVERFCACQASIVGCLVCLSHRKKCQSGMGCGIGLKHVLTAAKNGPAPAPLALNPAVGVVPLWA
jgi:hypothetical protein